MITKQNLIDCIKGKIPLFAITSNKKVKRLSNISAINGMGVYCDFEPLSNGSIWVIFEDILKDSFLSEEEAIESIKTEEKAKKLKEYEQLQLRLKVLEKEVNDDKL